MVEEDSSIKNISAKTKVRERREQMVEYLGDMITPQTDGFDHINLDMSFSYLGMWDIMYVENLSVAITMSSIYDLKQSEYLLRGMLATRLNVAKSRDAKTMQLFTHWVTKSEQEFKDKTDKKQGFSWFNFSKKKNE